MKIGTSQGKAYLTFLRQTESLELSEIEDLLAS